MLGKAFRTSTVTRLPYRVAFAHVKLEVIDDDLIQYMHGRKFSERRDSVSREILLERKRHQEKFSSVAVDGALVRSLRHVKLGTKKQLEGVYEQIASQHQTHGGVDMQTKTGAGGFSMHVASAARDWPIFKHLLPEVVFAGHSNSGKSTLVNGLSGVLPRKGPASTSERAGWTDQICFYQLGKKPPKMTLVDFPGYGHAIATPDDRREWIRMTRNYLANRSIITRCCILVDCTRGLCHGDRSLIRYLNRMKIPWLVIMTKGDLLSSEELAASITLVRQEILDKNLISVKPEKHEEESNYLGDENDASDEAKEAEMQLKPKKDENKRKTDGGVKQSVGSPRNFDSTSAASLNKSIGSSGSGNVSVDAASDLEIDPTGLTFDDEDSYLEAVVPENKSTAATATSNKKKKKRSPTALGVGTDSAEEESIEETDGVTILPVSANTGAGVQALWDKLCAMADEDAVMGSQHSVREHRKAEFQRKKSRIEKMLTMAKAHNITMVKKKAPVIRK